MTLQSVRENVEDAALSSGLAVAEIVSGVLAATAMVVIVAASQIVRGVLVVRGSATAPR